MEPEHQTSPTLENLRMHDAHACYPQKKWPILRGQSREVFNGAVTEKSPQIFQPTLPGEYVTAFSGPTEAPEVSCHLTDRQTQQLP